MRICEWIWILSGLALVVVTYDSHRNPGDVYGIYHDATTRWLGARELYLKGSGFQYLPTSTFLWTPLVTCFEAGEGAMVWRWLNWGVFALGTHVLAARLGANRPRTGSIMTAVVTGMVAWTAGKHGQATLMMAGLTLLALEAHLRGRSWLGAAALAVAVAIKPLALVSLLLVLVTRPGLGVRAALLVAAIVGATLIHPSPAYAAAQWGQVPAMLAQSAGGPVRGFGLIHVFSLLDGLGVSVTTGQADALRVLAALATAILVVRIDRRSGPNSWPLLVYGASVVYLLLFSHRTENNTYGILGPVLAVLSVRALDGRRTLRLAGYLTVLLVLQTSRGLSHVVVELGPHVTRPAATLLCLLLAARELMDMSQPGERVPAAGGYRSLRRNASRSARSRADSASAASSGMVELES